MNVTPKYDAMCAAIDAARATADEIYQCEDLSALVHVIHDLKLAEQRCLAIRLRAEREAKKLIRESQR